MKFFHFFAATVFCLIGGLTALGASGDTGNPFQEVVKPNQERMDRSWKRYKNPDLGYCLSYPSRWSRGSAFEGAGLLLETGSTRSSKPMGEIDIGPIRLEPMEEDARLKPVSLTDDDRLTENLKEHLAGLQKFARAERLDIIDQHAISVQGAKALFLKNSYYDPLERTSWLEEVVFVSHKGELYRMELQCPPNQVKRFEPVFAYLVNSLEFDCK